jgi:dTDP-D-glucose 4,6-dehydratase
MKIVVIGGTGLIGSKTISKSLFSMALIDTRMAAPLLYAGGRADVASWSSYFADPAPMSRWVSHRTFDSRCS